MRKFYLEDFLATFFDSINKTKETLNKRCYRQWFKNLWEANADQYEFYELANEIHCKVFGSPLSFSKWEEAWQYRSILSSNYKQAKIEFINALVGWY